MPVNSIEAEVDIVTPHVGVWIETSKRMSISQRPCVTPHVGVWIETQQTDYYVCHDKSHLM